MKRPHIEHSVWSSRPIQGWLLYTRDAHQWAHGRHSRGAAASTAPSDAPANALTGIIVSGVACVLLMLGANLLG